MKLGYARVSTTDQQDLAIQRVRLHEAGCEKLFEEKTSSAGKKRPELERLLAELRVDEVVVVTRLDRLARSTSELLRIAETIEEKNAGLQSIAEPWADTTTPAGRMVLTVFRGIAEFERSLIATRTEEGRRAAQARGVPFGRPPKLRPDLQCPCRNDLSLSPRRGGLMTVHRSARTHGPRRKGVGSHHPGIQHVPDSGAPAGDRAALKSIWRIRRWTRLRLTVWPRSSNSSRIRRLP